MLSEFCALMILKVSHAIRGLVVGVGDWESGDRGSSPGVATTWLCSLEQVALSVWASVFSSCTSLWSLPAVAHDRQLSAPKTEMFHLGCRMGPGPPQLLSSPFLAWCRDGPSVGGLTPFPSSSSWKVSRKATERHGSFRRGRSTPNCCDNVSSSGCLVGGTWHVWAPAFHKG